MRATFSRTLRALGHWGGRPDTVAFPGARSVDAVSVVHLGKPSGLPGLIGWGVERRCETPRSSSGGNGVCGMMGGDGLSQGVANSDRRRCVIAIHGRRRETGHSPPPEAGRGRHPSALGGRGDSRIAKPPREVPKQPRRTFHPRDKPAAGRVCLAGDSWRTMSCPAVNSPEGGASVDMTHCPLTSQDLVPWLCVTGPPFKG